MASRAEKDREKDRVNNQLRRMASLVIPGTPVWYYPHINSETKHAAVIDAPARELGEGQWVVRLRDLDEHYVKMHPAGRTTIPAVSLAAVELRSIDDQ